MLDLNLPVMDGLDVLKEIRRENAWQRVLILSARTEIEDKIARLDVGANDYVGKPFHFLEVEARVRAMIYKSLTIPGQREGGCTVGLGRVVFISIVGAGTNRMNVQTVAKPSQGLADYGNKSFLEEWKRRLAARSIGW